MAAKARSVHLMYSVDKKLGRKGGAKTPQQWHHPESGIFCGTLYNIIAVFQNAEINHIYLFMIGYT